MTQLAGTGALKEAFPDMPEGEECSRLLESCAAKSDEFAVLVIGLDNFGGVVKRLGVNVTASIMVRLARIIDGLSKAHAMEWGRIDQARFACFCPEMNETAAVQLANEIQRRITPAGDETVSIGVAVCPFWPFERTSVLQNARKALDHAAFFGPNTVTPFDAVSLNISADKLYQYGDIDGAIEEFKRALAVDPQNVNVLNSLGVCYGVKGRFGQAIEAFETAIKLDPQDVMATFNLGLAHFKQGDQEEALELFLLAHRLNGDNAEIAYQISLCYQGNGQAGAAFEYLEKAGHKARKEAHIFQALGEHYLGKEMFREAAKAFEKAIRLNPTSAKTLSNLGYIYGALGENMEIAVVLCRESTRIDPDSGLYRYRLGRLYLQKGEYDKALMHLGAATDLGEDCVDLIQEAKAHIHSSTNLMS